MVLDKSKGQHSCDATRIEGFRWVVEVLNVEQGGHKNIRVIEKNNGKIRRANSSENRNNAEAEVIKSSCRPMPLL